MVLLSANLWSLHADNQHYTTSISNIDLRGTITKESVELSFSPKTENIRYYIIERTHAEKLNFVKIGHLLPPEDNSELIYTDSDVTKGSSYHYRVCLLYTSPSPRD